MEEASSPGVDHHQIVSVANHKLNSTGDESWAMAKAFALWQLNCLPEAMSALDQAQSVCNNDPNFHMLRGIVARKLPDNKGFDIALQAYRQNCHCT